MNNANDLNAFLDEAWVHLALGVTDSSSPARYPTFATVSPEGKPEARTVALRGASRFESVLEIHTDITTLKVFALEHNPYAAFHIWLPKADLQIRLTAFVEILTGADVDLQWAKVPPSSRVSYGTVPPPGTTIEEAYAYKKPAKQNRFAVLKCNLKEIDLVHLGPSHRRASFVCHNNWLGTWLSP